MFKTWNASKWISMEHWCRILMSIRMYNEPGGESSIDCHKKMWKDLSKPLLISAWIRRRKKSKGLKMTTTENFLGPAIYSFPEKVIFIFPQNLVGTLTRMRLEGLLQGSGSLEKPTGFADLEWLTSKKGDDEYLFCSPFLFFIFPFKRSTQIMDNNFFTKLQPQFGEIQVVKSTHQPCDRLLYFLIFG